MIDPLAGFLGYQVRRASAVMMADLSATLAPLALKPTEASVLLAIAANAHATQSEVGRVLGIQRANMAPIVAMLIGRGIVERTAGDGRSHPMRLSCQGQAVAAQVRAAIARHEDRFLPDLAPDDRGTLLARLQDIRAGWVSASRDR